VKLKIDRAADALYLRFDDSRILESEKVAPGVIVDFDSQNNVVGVEVLHLSERAPQRRRSSSASARLGVAREKPRKKYRA
jgi:uncharacterized protein YuzE